MIKKMDNSLWTWRIQGLMIFSRGAKNRFWFHNSFSNRKGKRKINKEVSACPKNAGRRPCSGDSWRLRARGPAICSSRRAGTTGREWWPQRAAWRGDLQPSRAEQCSMPGRERRLRSLRLLCELRPSRAFLRRKNRPAQTKSDDPKECSESGGKETPLPVLLPCSRSVCFWGFRSRGAVLSSFASPAMSCGGKKLNQMLPEGWLLTYCCCII